MTKKLLLFAYYFFTLFIASAQSWVELGTGANALNAADYINSIFVDASGNVYAAGYFTDSNNYYYVAKWDGTSWTELGKGGDSLKASLPIRSIFIDNNNNVYAGGGFKDANGKEYVAKWNGSTWSELGTGANALGTSGSSYIYSVFVDGNDNVYAAGQFYDANDHIYVAKWNGSTWSELGTGANAFNTSLGNYIECIYVDASGNVYAGGQYTDSNKDLYIGEFNGISWSELSTGKKLLNANSYTRSICMDNTGNIYAAGNFTDSSGKFYVGKLNGSVWEEFGTGNAALNANGDIYTISADNAGNLYAGGAFTDTSGNEYIAKWDGASWSQLGNSITPSGHIISIFADAFGNIYAAGTFKNANGKYYVAKYEPGSATGVTNSVSSTTILSVYPNPTNGNITITAPEGGQVNFYNSLGQAVVTQTIAAGGSSISIDKLSTGIYTIVLTGQNNSYTSAKIVKE